MMNDEFKKFGKVGVLMGGYSSEREISLKSGKAVSKALKEHLDDVADIDITEITEEDITERIRFSRIDIAFIALHGELGEDGKIQNILDNLGIPYTGSGAEASRIAINKVLSQAKFLRQNIKIAPYAAINVEDKIELKNIVGDIGGFPLVVKPACEGSSIGIKFVNDLNEMDSAIKHAFEIGDDVLVEKYIKGKELTVGILDDKPLPVIEIRPKAHFFDFLSKYHEGMTDYIVPADISDDERIKAQELALRAYNVLGCSDFSRVDLILDDNGSAFVLEVNTIPGFTSTSLLPKAAKSIGINFDKLCLQLLGLAYGKKKKEIYSSSSVD